MRGVAGAVVGRIGTDVTGRAVEEELARVWPAWKTRAKTTPPAGAGPCSIDPSETQGERDLVGASSKNISCPRRGAPGIAAITAPSAN